MGSVKYLVSKPYMSHESIVHTKLCSDLGCHFKLSTSLQILLLSWLQCVLLVAEIAHVEADVVAARKEGLLVCSVPAHSLQFFAVEISVSGFASQFIEIPTGTVVSALPASRYSR